jgi:hypothetical protein
MLLAVLVSFSFSFGLLSRSFCTFILKSLEESLHARRLAAKQKEELEKKVKEMQQELQHLKLVSKTKELELKQQDLAAKEKQLEQLQQKLAAEEKVRFDGNLRVQVVCLPLPFSSLFFTCGFFPFSCVMRSRIFWRSKSNSTWFALLSVHARKGMLLLRSKDGPVGPGYIYIPVCVFSPLT